MLKILRTGMREGYPGCNYKGKLKVACLRWLGHSSEKQGPGPLVYFLWKPNQVSARVYAKSKDVQVCFWTRRERSENTHSWLEFQSYREYQHHVRNPASDRMWPFDVCRLKQQALAFKSLQTRMASELNRIPLVKALSQRAGISRGLPTVRKLSITCVKGNHSEK